MKLSHASIAAGILALTGCKAPVEAPAELNDLSRYMYREWENEDPEVLTAGLSNLEPFLLAEVDYEGDSQDRSFTLTPIEEADLHAISWPTDRNPADTLALSVTAMSPWPVTDHARLQVEVDQTPTEPTAKTYERTFPQTSDPTCLPEQSCDTIVSINNARRENALLSVDFVLNKDFRWTTTSDGRDVLIARSWFDQSWEGDGGSTMLWQSYSTDIWIEQPDGGTLRYQALWSESDVGSSGDDVVLGTLRYSIDKIFKAGDDSIEELYHTEE